MSITYAIEKSYKKEDKSLSKIFKPRRGTENTMKTVKSNTVLAAGELFAELPNTGPGTGKGRLVMGDGVTAYGNLPSFVENTDVSTAQVTVTADNSATSTAAINNVSSGATTGALIGSLKQAISLTKSELTNTIDDLNKYIEQTKTTSTSADTVYTFTDSEIKSTSLVKVRANKWGIIPSNVVTTNGQTIVTIPKQDTEYSLGIRIYII